MSDDRNQDTEGHRMPGGINRRLEEDDVEGHGGTFRRATDDDTEGHRMPGGINRRLDDDDTEGHGFGKLPRIDEDDVEGHGGTFRRATDDDDDTEGHIKNIR